MPQDTTFDHTGFFTHDLAGTLEFWTGVMGFEAQPTVTRAAPWVEGFTGVPGATLKIAHVFGHGAHLEFIEFASAGLPPVPVPTQQPLNAHVCFKVADLQAVHDAILAGGGGNVGQITTITEGGIAGSKGLYMRDPNGILIELLQIVS